MRIWAAILTRRVLFQRIHSTNVGFDLRLQDRGNQGSNPRARDSAEEAQGAGEITREEHRQPREEEAGLSQSIPSSTHAFGDDSIHYSTRPWFNVVVFFIPSFGAERI